MKGPFSLQVFSL